MQKYLILDRDGVINYDSKYFIKSPDEWEAIPGSLEAMADLNKAGYKIVIATNQSAIARGIFLQETLDSIHQKMIDELAKFGGNILDIFYCPHHPDDGCECRKPRPGMLLDFAKKYNADLSNICMVGDRTKDILAAKAAGAMPHFVKTNYSAEFNDEILKDVMMHENLAEFATWLIKQP